MVNFVFKLFISCSYTIFSTIVQFIIPIIVISIIYHKISTYLKKNRFRDLQHTLKQRKTNSILLSFSLFFLIRFKYLRVKGF